MCVGKTEMSQHRHQLGRNPKGKVLEKLERKRQAKGKKGTKPVSGKSVEPAQRATPAPTKTTVSKPAPAPVAGPSKPKKRVEVSLPARLPPSGDDSDIPLLDKGKGKQVARGKGKQASKPAPIVLSSDGDSIPAPKGRRSFQGTWYPHNTFFINLFCSN